MIKRLSIILLLFIGTAYPIGYQNGTFRSRSTQGTQWTGTAHITKEHFRISVYPTYLDVELEWEFSVGGTAPREHRDKLEIVGNLNLEDSSVVVGMLLWYKDMMLKAKLKKRETAREQYEDVVDRNVTIPPRPRDPVLLEWIRDDNYDISIFPVTWGQTRRLRMRYLVPGRTWNGITKMRYPHAFTRSATATIMSGFGVTGFTVDSRYGTVEESVEENTTLEGPILQAYGSGDRLSYITPNTPGRERGISTRTVFQSVLLDDLPASGHFAYVSEFAVGKILDTLRGVALQVGDTATPGFLSLYAILGNGQAVCSTGATIPIPDDGTFSSLAGFWKGFYIHSSLPIKERITWHAYYNHELVFAYEEKPRVKWFHDGECHAKIAAASDRIISLDRQLPKSMAAAFGYIDQEYALLALETDVLPLHMAGRYADEGVPMLNNEDIFPDTSDLAMRSAENLYQDNPFITAIQDKLAVGKTLLDGVKYLIRNNTLLLQITPELLAKHKRIEIALYTPAGRLLKIWRKRDIAGRTRLEWSPRKRGLAAGMVMVVVKLDGIVKSRLVPLL